MAPSLRCRRDQEHSPNCCVGANLGRHCRTDYSEAATVWGRVPMVRSGIGDAPKRREDHRFLTGAGRYLDDLAFDHLTHAVVLRSAHAHAHIRDIDAAAAQLMPGVLAVLTAADAGADALKPLLPYVEANTQTGEPFAFAPQPLLAEDKVRYVGEPIALNV